MKSKSQLEKWVTGLLGLVCLVLVFNLAFRGGSKGSSAKPAAAVAKPSPGPRPRGAAPRSGDELARYDPAVHIDILEKIQKRPKPKLARNPFEFVPRESPSGPGGPGGPGGSSVVPTPPPPPPLKAVGYTEKSSGVREAIVSLADEIFVIHEGETFAKRYRVLKITPTQIEVNDETTQQNIRLPYSS